MKLRPGTNTCWCRACGECFNSVHAFDKHRTGPATNRRCLDTAEMEKAGMSVNARGYWISKRLKTTPDFIADTP